ncbi:SRPBCC domain-containing protein [Schlesneria sp. DSM 10557]|uniref:SRPBCC family protein n=1 Tax=Schlesneria sp. DSM 10557 TaxID=3044399 RepID=UPI002F046395
MQKKNDLAVPQVLIVREFSAPRELVFEAWTSESQLCHWFAPSGCQIRYRKFDFREGGEYHSCILTPDGKECWCRGEYRKIQQPELIEFTMAVSNAAMQPVEPQDVGMDPQWPRETIVTVFLEEIPTGTRLTLRQTVDEALAKRTGAHPSWLSMFDRLAERLN